MPLIHGTSTNTNAMLLGASKTKARFVLHKIFDYPMEEIAFYPRILTEQEECFSDNILPIEFTIDIGAKPNMNIGEPYAEKFRDRLLKKCPELAKINFGVWIREMQSNGFAEHKPE